MPDSTTTNVPKSSQRASEELSKATEAIYKQNFELSVKNKTLSVLRSLYAITMSSVKVSEVAQHIVDAIVKELSFSGAIISLIKQEEKILELTAITQPEIIENILKPLGKTLRDIAIPLDDESNLGINALKMKERMITGNLLDIFIPDMTQEIADMVEQKLAIKTVIVYPLYFGSEALGTLAIGIGKKIDDLSLAEKETLDQLIDVVIIAIERAKLHENLETANTQLKALDRLKDEFVSLASHELRTPMTAIRGSLSTILEGYAGEIAPTVRDFLLAAYNENDRLIRLVNNLLNISRIESGRFTFTVAAVKLEAVINEVVTNLVGAAKEKNLSLIYDHQGVLPAVDADADKVREVLINIIGNALKFTHKGGVTVRTAVDAGFVVTSITDTGSGIARDDQELLFKKFSQVQGSYAKQSGGTGLGLYICKIIIEGLNGKIWLDSTLGVGSTFHFSLPINVNSKV